MDSHSVIVRLDQRLGGSVCVNHDGICVLAAELDASSKSSLLLPGCIVFAGTKHNGYMVSAHSANGRVRFVAEVRHVNNIKLVAMISQPTRDAS
jgi:hypothetical protein